MPDPKSPAEEQLRLNLGEIEKSTNSKGAAGTVISFVDAGTLAVRRQAIERVKARGIFQPPNLENR